MQTCIYISWVGRYYDGELPESRRAELEQHLRQCSQCAAELDELQRLSRALVSPGAAPQSLSPQAIRRLHEYADQTIAVTDQSLRRFAEILTGLAAALLIASSAWLLQTSDVAAAEPTAPWESAAVVLRAGADTISGAPVAPSLNTARWIVTQLEQSQKSDEKQ
jgi:anti-sigma factor RsiW